VRAYETPEFVHIVRNLLLSEYPTGDICVFSRTSWRCRAFLRFSLAASTSLLVLSHAIKDVTYERTNQVPAAETIVMILST